jgi:hypothetical protein
MEFLLKFAPPLKKCAPLFLCLLAFEECTLCLGAPPQTCFALPLPLPLPCLCLCLCLALPWSLHPKLSAPPLLSLVRTSHKSAPPLASAPPRFGCVLPLASVPPLLGCALAPCLCPLLSRKRPQALKRPSHLQSAPSLPPQVFLSSPPSL